MKTSKTGRTVEVTGPQPESMARELRTSATFGQLQLSEAVAMHLRERIVSGQLAKGEFLRIDALANALGVSTTPVREGLLLLQSESSVTFLPRRGFVVNGFSKDDLHDLFWAQATLAAELAGRATPRMSRSDIARLEAIQSEHQAAYTANDSLVAARRGHEFHRTINLAAQAPRLALLLGRLTKQLPNRFYASIDGRLKDAVEQHPLILDAIRVQDAGAARALMFRHVMSAGQQLISMLERLGMWSLSARRIPTRETAPSRSRESEWPTTKRNSIGSKR